MLVDYGDSDEDLAPDEPVSVPDASKTLKIAAINTGSEKDTSQVLADTPVASRISVKHETAPALAASNLAKRMPDIKNRHLLESDEDSPRKPVHPALLQSQKKHASEKPLDTNSRTAIPRQSEADMKQLVPSQIKLKRPNKPIEL